MKILQAVFFGVLFVIASVALLFWGEGRAVATARALAEGARIVISADATGIDAANDGKLIHVSGEAVPQDTPRDTLFGIAAEGAVTLHRKVEMLQWKEITRDVEQTGSDGKTFKTIDYRYEKVWSGTPIDSASFHGASAPQNPSMPVEGESVDVAVVKLGAFSVAGSRISPLARFAPIPLTDAGIRQASAALRSTRPVWRVNDVFVSAENPDTPEVGDVRVNFSRGDVSRVSVVGLQEGEGLNDYLASNGKAIFLAESGDVPAQAMFKTANDDNTVLTWVLRGLGLFLMFFGFMMLLSPLTETLGRLSLIGELINGGAMLAALGMTMLVGGVVIGIGWIFFRPILGIAIILCGVLLAYGIGKLGGRKQPVTTG